MLGITTLIDMGNGRPTGLAVSPDGARLYAANNNNTVSVINTTTNTVIKTVNVFHAPAGLAVSPDGGRVYVTHWAYGADSTGLSTIDTATGTVTFNSLGGQTRGVAASPDGSRIYVTDFENPGSVWVIDVVTGTATAITVGG